MQKEAEKFAQSSLMEGMVSIRAVLRACEDGISDRKIEKILFDREKAKSKARELSFLRAKAKEHGFSIEFTDASTIAAATNKVSPIYMDLQNTRVDGLTVVNCKLEGNVSNMNFVYANATTAGDCGFTASLKNVNIIGNTVSGIARLCELREAENVTIKDNNVANLTRELALLGNNGTNAYSGNLVVTGNTADNIATDYAAQNLEGLFFRVGVGGDANVTVKNNVITNSGCVETSFVNVTGHTGTLTVGANATKTS